MRYFLLVAAAALSLIAGPAFAQSDPVLDQIVTNARAQIGRANPDWAGWSITAARAEGRALVLGLSPPSGAEEMFTPHDLSNILALGMCESTGSRFFEEGRILRIEFPGSGMPATDFRACPAVTRSELMLRGMARLSQQLVGTVIGPMRMRISRIHVDGSALVYTVDGNAGWRRQYPPEAVARDIFASYCRQGPSHFLLEGRSLRMDTLENGSGLRREASLSDCAAYPQR